MLKLRHSLGRWASSFPTHSLLNTVHSHIVLVFLAILLWKQIFKKIEGAKHLKNQQGSPTCASQRVICESSASQNCGRAQQRQVEKVFLIFLIFFSEQVRLGQVRSGQFYLIKYSILRNYYAYVRRNYYAYLTYDDLI